MLCVTPLSTMRDMISLYAFIFHCRINSNDSLIEGRIREAVPPVTPRVLRPCLAHWLGPKRILQTKFRV
jgi:hypothetical protein